MLDAFGGLIKEYGFKVEHEWEQNGEFMIVLSSGNVKIKVSTERLDIGCRVGPLCAPNTRDNYVDGKLIWNTVEMMNRFLVGQLDLERDAVFRIDVRRNEVVLNEDAERIASVFERVNELFGPKNLNRTLADMELFGNHYLAIIEKYLNE